MTREQVTEKIKKLLELATSPNEHEARRAMEMAQKLMINFNINKVDLKEADEIKIESLEYRNEEMFGKLGLLDQIPSIIQTIGPIFGVFGLLRANNRTGGIYNVTLFGYPTNLKIATYVIDSILAQGWIEFKAAYKLHRSAMFGLEFWDGFAKGLRKKFGEFSETGKGIIVYDPVKQHVKSLSGGTFNANQFVGDANSAGIAAGLKAEIRKGLQSSNTGKLLN